MKEISEVVGVRVKALIGWLEKRGQPNSGIRYQRNGPGTGIPSVELEGSDATFIAGNFHGKPALELSRILSALVHSEGAATSAENATVQPAEHDGLVEQIDALLALDAKGVLVPHGVGGLARELLEKSRAALSLSQDRSEETVRARPAVYIGANDVTALVTDDMADIVKAAFDAIPSPPFGEKLLPLYLAAPSNPEAPK